MNMSEHAPFIMSTSVHIFKIDKFLSLLAFGKYSNLAAHVDSSLYNTS